MNQVCSRGGVVSTSKAAGVSPAVVFEVYRREMALRVEQAHTEGFRAGRITPFRSLGSGSGRSYRPRLFSNERSSNG